MHALLSLCADIFPSKNPPAAPNTPIERERKEKVISMSYGSGI